MNRSVVEVDQSVVVSACGFLPNTSITIKVNGVLAETTKANAYGNVNAEVKLTTIGLKTITATGLGFESASLFEDPDLPSQQTLAAQVSAKTSLAAINRIASGVVSVVAIGTVPSDDDDDPWGGHGHGGHWGDWVKDKDGGWAEDEDGHWVRGGGLAGVSVEDSLEFEESGWAEDGGWSEDEAGSGFGGEDADPSGITSINGVPFPVGGWFGDGDGDGGGFGDDDGDGDGVGAGAVSLADREPGDDAAGLAADGPGGATSAGGALPFTGLETEAMATLALVMLGSGVAIRVVARRRRDSFAGTRGNG